MQTLFAVAVLYAAPALCCLPALPSGLSLRSPPRSPASTPGPAGAVCVPEAAAGAGTSRPPPRQPPRSAGDTLSACSCEAAPS